MRLLIVLLLLNPLTSFSQLFNPEVEWFSEENFFNKEFVKQHSIKEFRSGFSTKEDGEIIDETKSFTMAEFDRQGNLTKLVKGSEWLEKVDSTIYTFQYNNESQLINKGEFLALLRYQYIHDYNEANELEKIIKLDVSDLPSEVVSIKKFRHENPSEGKTIKYSLNDKGKAYIQETVERIDGKLQSRKMEYLVNSNFEKLEFNYIDGKLRTKTITSNIGRNIHKEFNYYYDEKGRYNEIVVSVEGQRVKKIAFVYNNDGLPSAMIERFYNEKKLNIYQFEYQFYY